MVLIEVVEDLLHLAFAALQVLELRLEAVELERLLDDLGLDLLLLDFLLLGARVGEVLLVDGQHLLLVDLDGERV